MDKDDSSKYLYQLHSEKYEDISDSETVEVGLEDENKPPGFTYEELRRNLVVFNGGKIRNYDSGNNSDVEEARAKSPPNIMKLTTENLGTFKKKEENLHLTEEQIHKKLKEQLTAKFCYICKKHNDSGTFYHHYNSGLHLTKVHRWLKDQIFYLKKPIEEKFLFCDACNLPLAGNNESKNHYNSANHIKNLATFCTVCCRGVPQEKASKHLSQKGHLNNASLKEPIIQETALNKPFIIDNQQPIIKKTTNNDNNYMSAYSQQCIPKQYRRLATYVLSFLRQSCCHVCDVAVAGSQHYQSRRHMQTFRKWLETNENLLELFGIRDLEELVCIGCRAVFHDSLVAELHYFSEEHKSTMQTFCQKCLIHETTTSHKEHNKQLEKENENKEPFIVKNNLNPSVLLASNLKIMMTPISCEICKTKITNNNLFHYTERNHIFMIRNWLSYGMQSLQAVVDPRLIYCEACTLVLCGSKAALAHYNTSEHFRNQPVYCAHCIFKGTPDSMLFHNLSPDHLLRFDQSVNLQQEFYSPIGQNLIYSGQRANPSVPPIVVANFMQSVGQRGSKEEELDREVNRLLELLYCCGREPPEEAVNFLKFVNEKLVKIMYK